MKQKIGFLLIVIALIIPLQMLLYNLFYDNILKYIGKDNLIMLLSFIVVVFMLLGDYLLSGNGNK